VTTQGSGRDLKVRVKSGKGRTLSSKLWLERQLNDPYVGRARRDGYRSRAAYKLIEIDDKHRIIKPGARVVDLGAAPGGWSHVAAKRAGAGEGRGHVAAIDLLEMGAIPGADVLQLDFLDPSAPARLKAFVLNAERIRYVEQTPDTVICCDNGDKLMVKVQEPKAPALEVWDDYGSPVERVGSADPRWQFQGAWKIESKKQRGGPGDDHTRYTSEKGAEAAITPGGAGAVV
jgi:23S rRNA U2552 (ribose-2'-O)-methylase RlmE/FtsJ